MKISKSLHLFAVAVFTSALLFSACSTSAQSGSATLSALDAIATRTSVRSYEQTPVGADTVELLLKAAMAAPSARNRQPWAFVVVDDKALLQEMGEKLPYAKMAAKAPLAIVVCGDLLKEGQPVSEMWWVQDTSAATENLLLAAHAVGLGAVWTGAYPYAERVQTVREVLNLPDNLVPLCVVPVGYPAENPASKQKWDPAKVYKNRFAE